MCDTLIRLKHILPGMTHITGRGDQNKAGGQKNKFTIIIEVVPAYMVSVFIVGLSYCC